MICVLAHHKYITCCNIFPFHEKNFFTENILEENEEEILKEVKSPQMFLPARSDKDSVKMNGLGKKILGDGVEIIEFPDMSHGWTTRGDLSDPKVERDVKKAFNFVISFFGKYL